MVFNSFSFALFLPIVFLLYWIPFKSRLKWQNFLLLIASYSFYAAWDWRFTILIAFTSLSSWSCGLLMDRYDKKKLFVGINTIINLGILAYFKYAGFFVSSFVAFLSVFGIDVSGITTHIILPVGISFYTFQAIGYTVDVYRGEIESCKDPIKFFAFISFFPQLVAGPIERASNLLPQFREERTFIFEEATRGLFLIIWGLFMKIVIADRLAVFVDGTWTNLNEAYGVTAFVAVIFFAFQLYIDFYSYSEIARGCAKLFGMNLMINFKRPYLSKSFKEFWKRWHISLSSWFSKYVYISLGGNRRG